MPAPLNVQADTHMVSQHDVNEYRKLGHSGYVLAYRAKHNGADPKVEELNGVAKTAEAQSGRGVVRIFKMIIDIFT